MTPTGTTAWHLPRGYAALDAFLGDRKTRRLCNNTHVDRFDIYEERIVVTLHATRIVTFYPDGRIVLNSGGYRTSTTKARMNAILPDGLRVTQTDFEWTVGGVAFEDNMTINSCGLVSLPSERF